MTRRRAGRLGLARGLARGLTRRRAGRLGQARGLARGLARGPGAG